MARDGVESGRRVDGRMGDDRVSIHAHTSRAVRTEGVLVLELGADHG
jgi:hypothetical protein